MFNTSGLQIFFKIGGPKRPIEQKWWVIFWNDGLKHIKLTTSILYLHTETITCMYVDCWLYSKTCLKRPLKKEDQLSLNAGQKYCRMLQGEHSAILSTFIKLPFAIKIFVLTLSILSGYLRHVLLYWLSTYTFCFVEFADSLWGEHLNLSEIFSQLKRMGPLGPLPWKVMGHYWNHGTMTRAHHKSEGLMLCYSWKYW